MSSLLTSTQRTGTSRLSVLMVHLLRSTTAHTPCRIMNTISSNLPLLTSFGSQWVPEEACDIVKGKSTKCFQPTPQNCTQQGPQIYPALGGRPTPPAL